MDGPGHGIQAGAGLSAKQAGFYALQSVFRSEIMLFSGKTHPELPKKTKHAGLGKEVATLCRTKFCKVLICRRLQNRVRQRV
jgi:hypothetical protein